MVHILDDQALPNIHIYSIFNNDTKQCIPSSPFSRLGMITGSHTSLTHVKHRAQWIMTSPLKWKHRTVPCWPTSTAELTMQQQPVWEGRPESIALTFTQTQNDQLASQASYRSRTHRHHHAKLTIHSWWWFKLYPKAQIADGSACMSPVLWCAW